MAATRRMISAQISSSQDPQAACCRMACRAAAPPGIRARRSPAGTGAPGACPDILAHRNSQPNHVIRRLNNTGAALKCSVRCASDFGDEASWRPTRLLVTYKLMHNIQGRNFRSSALCG